MLALRAILRISIVFVVLALVFANAPYATAGIVIYNSWNGDGTFNDPSILPTFTTSQPWFISEVFDYHFNYGMGQDPVPINGWIGIYDLSTGSFVIQESAVGEIDSFGVLSGWQIYPNAWLPPGSYEVVDSDPLTWSYTVTDFYPIGQDWEPYKGFTEIIAAATPEPGTLLLLLGPCSLVLARYLRRR